MRVDPVLTVALALLAGGAAVVAPLPTLAAFAGVGLVLRRHVSRRVVAAAVVAFGIGALRAGLAVPAFEARLSQSERDLSGPRRCSGPGSVASQPVVRGGTASYLARFDELDCEGRAVHPTLVRLSGGPADLRRGDRIRVVAQLAVVELFRNAELPDPTPRAARSGATLSGGALAVTVLSRSHGLAAWIDRARARARERIEATFPADAAPLARALVLGEADLSVDDDAAFRASGLSHLLAVSGTHLVFAVLGIVHALGFVLVRVERLAARWEMRCAASLAGAILAPLYADFAGGSGSAWRAALMLTVALAARALGRRPRASRSFALSLLAGASWDPLVGFDVSFLLSAAATSGLLVFGGPLARWMVPEGAGPARRAVAGSCAATVAAMLPCAPLLAGLGPRLTLAGVAANVLAAPFGEVVSLPLCLLHGVVVLPSLERGIGLVAGGALLVVRWLAHASAAATWLAVPVPPPGAWHFAVLAVGGVGALVSGFDGPPDPRSRAAFLVPSFLAICMVECAAVRAGHPRGALRVTVLDVGQGDSTLVDLPDGSLMLVDGGGFVGSPVDPGRSVVLPVLRARRRSRVDVVVLSHPHPDHFLGLASALPELEVGEFWDTGQGREQGAGTEYAGLVEGLVRRRVPIRGAPELCRAEPRLGGADVRVLAPCPSWEPALGANDNSFVIRVAYGGHAALFMGDAEHEGEERLLASHADLRADLLKTGHHGSRTSTSPELLRAVRPAVATVSCGVRNRFGHPHEATLATLASAGVTALRTDRVGSMGWRAARDGLGLRVAGFTFAERLRAGLW